MRAIKNHPLIRSLLGLKGNPRTLVYLEPLWGIPYNLIAPFATLYMYAQGVNDTQIGLILSISAVVKVLFSLMGGVIADKLGRKTTTVLGDLLGWSIACLMWALSNNFWWFLAATLMNSFEQVNQTAWQCLLIEDVEDKEVVNIYTWVMIGGLVAVFFAPLSGIFISRFSLVPVVRVLYATFAFTMLFKSWITLTHTSETRQGMIRKEQTRHVSAFKMVKEYRGLWPLLFKSKNTARIFIVTVLLSITGMITSTFFGLYANQSLGAPESSLALFPILRAAVMLVFFFGLAHVMDRFKMKRPLIIGLIIYIGALILLVLSPRGQIWTLYLYTFIEAVGYSLAIPRKDSMMVIDIDKDERARLLALVVTISFVVSSPFGYLAGLLSAMDRRLPFVFSALLYLASVVVMLGYDDKTLEEA